MHWSKIPATVFREAEKKVIGIDHAEMGALIAKIWKFSPRMIKLIHHHHLRDESMMDDKEVAARLSG